MDGVSHASETRFDELEQQAVTFARAMLERGECSECVCRALAFAAMGLASTPVKWPASATRWPRCCEPASKLKSPRQRCRTTDASWPAPERMIDARRKVTAQRRIYNSKHWKAARRQAMHAAEFVCQHPGCTEVLSGSGNCHVHHLKPLRQAPALAFEPLNHQALCPSHHSVETVREQAAAKGKPERGCDADGNPLSPQHPWNHDRKSGGGRVGN